MFMLKNSDVKSSGAPSHPAVKKSNQNEWTPTDFKYIFLTNNWKNNRVFNKSMYEIIRSK